MLNSPSPRDQKYSQANGSQKAGFHTPRGTTSPPVHLPVALMIGALHSRGQAMARFLKQTKSDSTGDHRRDHTRERVGSTDRDSFSGLIGSPKDAQLGRNILVELLVAAAEVLRGARQGVQRVQLADPAGITRGAEDVSAPTHAETSERSRDRDEDVDRNSSAPDSPQPRAASLNRPRFRGRGPVGVQARRPNEIAWMGKAEGGVPIYKLRRTSCRWPLGPLLAHTDRFCGAATIPGCPYCAEHRERAFARRGVQRAKDRAAGTYNPLQ